MKPLANDLKVVLRVMKAKGIRRILALSTPSYPVPGETVIFLYFALHLKNNAPCRHVVHVEMVGISVLAPGNGPPRQRGNGDHR